MSASTSHITSSTSPVVSAKGLRKVFGTLTVVDDIDFTIPRGKCFGFLGPNGAGKTTTLRMLLGLSPMTAGELTIFGQPVSPKTRERMGVVPQLDNLDPDFSVIENLELYASYFRIPRVEASVRIERLLRFTALSEKRYAKTETLSGGMKRRLTIARALINEPELVVLDEPTTGLDPQVRHAIWSRLNDLRAQGTTLILTTHYMEEAERLCDELVIMDHGRILDHGTPRALIKRHVEAEVIEIRSETAKGLVLEDLPECRVEDLGTSLYCYTHHAAPLIQHLQDSPGVVFMHRPAGLEDVFLTLTGRELRD